MGVLSQRVAAVFERNQGCDVEPRRIRQGPASVAGADQNRALFREKPCGMLADRAEALHNDARAVEIETDKPGGHVDTGRDAESGGADLVEAGCRRLRGEGRPRDRSRVRCVLPRLTSRTRAMASLPYW